MFSPKRTSLGSYLQQYIHAVSFQTSAHVEDRFCVISLHLKQIEFKKKLRANK